MLLLTEGRFGAAVATELASPHDDFAAAASTGFAAVREGMFVGVATRRRSNSVFDALDEACRVKRARWGAVYMSGRTLRCGPTLAPADGPCYRCLRARVLTHSYTPERDLLLDEVYLRDPSLGGNGFIGAVAGLAATLLGDAERAGLAGIGRLVRLDVLSGHVMTLNLVRVHGCERCGRGGNRQERFSRYAISELAAMGRA